MKQEILTLQEYLLEMGYKIDALKISWVYYHNGKDAALSFFSNSHDWSFTPIEYSPIKILKDDIEDWEKSINAYPQIKCIFHFIR